MSTVGTFIASAVVVINGTTISRVNHLRLNQRFETHHDFEFSVSPEMLRNRNITLREVADSFVGKMASILLTQRRAGMPEQRHTFSGIVTSVKVVKGQSQTSTFLISGTSPTILLAAGPTTRSFTNKSLSDIVTEVMAPFHFTRRSGLSASPIPYVVQYEEDNFHFLQRLAEQHSQWVFYDGDTFMFGNGMGRSTPTVALIHGQNLFNMEYGLRVTPLNFTTQYFNYEAHNTFHADASAETVTGLSSFPQLGMDRSAEVFSDPLINLGYNNFDSEAALKQAVKFEKSERSNRVAVFTGQTPEMELKIGGLITVTEPAVPDGAPETNHGTFVVVGLSHFVDASGTYRAYVEAVPDDRGFPPVDYRIIPPIARTQNAVVMETNDNLSLGRLKVKFLWQVGTEETTPFIRVANPMAGRSKGYFIPEEGDIVVVDFEFGNPEMPFVSGALYANDASRSPGAELFTNDNMIKGYITKGGNHIIIDDTSEKEKIRIFNKENKNKIELSLDGGSHINIHSEGTINMSATNINIKASEELKMEGKDLVKIDSDTLIEAKSQDELKLYGISLAGIGSDDKCLSSGARVGITASSEMKIESTTIEVTANATMDVKATASLSMDGGAAAALKGAMVMIN